MGYGMVQKMIDAKIANSPFFCIMSEDRISGRKWLNRAPTDIMKREIH